MIGLLLKIWLFFKPATYSIVDEGILQGGELLNDLPCDVQAVLSLQAEYEDKYTPSRIKAFAWMPIKDSYPFPGVQWLDAAVNTIIAWRKAGWVVLIHCFEGKSRSGMVDVAYHMKINKWKSIEALDYVRSKRPETDPNTCFLEGLLKYEQYLRL
jgi:protein-tyrosine phosphatase